MQVEIDKHVYLIKGDSHRLVSDGETAFIKAFQAKTDVEVVVLNGSITSAPEIVNALSQSYMFAESAIVSLREVDQFGVDELDPLLEYLSKELSGGSLVNYLLLSSYGGSISQKLIKLVTTHGLLEDQKLGDKADRRAFLDAEIERSSLQFRPDALKKIDEHVGEDVDLVRSLIEVLESSFDGGSTLSQDDVEPYLSRLGQRPIYLITGSIEACRSGEEGRVLGELDVFLNELGVHPLALFSVISKRIIEIASVQGDHIKTTDDVNLALADAGLKKKSPYATKKLIEASQALGFTGVKKALNWCAETEAGLKGVGAMPDAFVLELLVARLSNLFSRQKISARSNSSNFNYR